MPREASPVERRDGDKEKDSDPKRDMAPSGHREKGDRDRERDRDRDRNRDRDRDRDGDRATSRDRGHEHSKRRREDSRERGRDDDAKRARRSRSRERANTRDREREPARRAGDRDREPSKRSDDRRPDERDRRSERERDHDRDRDRRPDRGSSRDRDRDRERNERHSSRRPEDREAAANGTKADSHAEENGVADPEEGEVLPGAPEAKQKTEPLSLEELVKKREAEALAASKPVFLSKKQREELALKRRQDEAAAQVAARNAITSPTANGAGGSDSRRREDDRRRDDDHRRDDGRRRDDDRRRDDRRRDDPDRKQRDIDREREKELEMIKAQYLGGEKKKKKVLKGAEKFKFNFDWEAGDDTSRDLNPLYNSTHEAALLFGRGLRAGVDRREQKKASANHEADLLRKVREAQGIKDTDEDRRRDRNRKAMADAYDKSSMKVGSHWSEKARDDMTERDWRIFREDHNIAYRGAALDKSTLPIRNWQEAGLPKTLVKAVDALGYTKPSPIQMAAIPLGMQFRDVIGIAETGSGKTAAFVLPMLTYILKQPKMTEEVAAEGPYAVIMAPTRELAQQIEEEAVKMAQYTEFRFVCVVGGQSIEDQGFKLRKGCEVIIATPGRLIDCLEQRYAVLNQCNYIVLDEADRMIDLGFEPQVIGVMDAMPNSNLKPEGEDAVLESDRMYRTTYMFSATMPPAVERLARKYLRRPVVINIGSAGKSVDLITQRVVVVKDNEKPSLLERELSYFPQSAKVVVFVNTKRQCDTVASILADKGLACTILHGGKSQDQREEGLKGFRDGSFPVLVATDVAGRGIDVPDVAMVVNYDMPNSIENYTHRIGRTGRAGRKGVAVTFLTMSDTEVFYDLKKFLEDAKAAVPHQLASHEASKTKPGSIEGKSRRDTVIFAKK